jgi:hypothetical protein
VVWAKIERGGGSFGVLHNSAPHNARLGIRRVGLEHEPIEVVRVGFRDGENLPRSSIRPSRRPGIHEVSATYSRHASWS